MVLEQENNLRGGGGWWSRSFKKPKLPKPPPQRGLGVAQLEKILREQEEKMDDTNRNAAPTGPPPSQIIGSSPHPHHSPVRPNPMPPLMTTLSHSHSHSHESNFLGGIGGGFLDTGGSAMVLLEHDYFPLNSSGSNSDAEASKFNSEFDFPIHFPEDFYPSWPSSSMSPEKNQQYPPWMNLLFPFGSSSWSTGMNHQIEPPSNQRSYSYTSPRPGEEKTAGTKRPRHFSVDAPLAPIYPPQVLPRFPDQMHVADQPSSCRFGSTISFQISKEISRVTKKDTQIKQNSKKCNTDCATLDANFLTLGLPATSSQSTKTIHEGFSGFHSFPFQECIDKPSQSSGHGGLSHQKPFYNFLPTNRPAGWTEKTRSSSHKRAESEADGGDLNLKLSLGSFNGEPRWAFLRES